MLQIGRKVPYGWIVSFETFEPPLKCWCLPKGYELNTTCHHWGQRVHSADVVISHRYWVPSTR